MEHGLDFHHLETIDGMRDGDDMCYIVTSRCVSVSLWNSRNFLNFVKAIEGILMWNIIIVDVL